MRLDSLTFAVVVPALANHLWQSTAFLAAAGLLALVLRKNHARVRYGLWLAASMKFLLPFSLLMAAGSHLAGLWSAPAIGANPGMYAAIDQVSQPFDRMAVLNAPAATGMAQPTAHSQNLHLTLLAVAWLAGFLAVLGLRYSQWRGIAKVLRSANPLTAGREVETLRRMEKIAGLPKQIEMRLPRESLEPGIVGVVSPVLLWPEGISRHLDNAQLEAVLAHEICHVRRRDNLTSMLHMLVEAIFWFYPLVWWLEKPLVAERERACDEEVLRLGRQPQTYAESILKVCEFCVESPLACVSGITGADLKKRVVRIMTASLGEGLSGGRKALLAAAAFVAIAVPIVLGQFASAMRPTAQQNAPAAAAPLLQFDVVSVKLNKSGESSVSSVTVGSPSDTDGITITNLPLHMIIEFAYDFHHPDLVLELPAWTKSERYDLVAKVTGADVTEYRKLTEEQHMLMLQEVLMDRFTLKVHRETRNQAVYALVVSRNGLKMKEAKPGEIYPSDLKATIAHGGTVFVTGPEQITGYDSRVETLAAILSNYGHQFIGRQVVDRTGLTGLYDFTLQWSPEEHAEIGSDGAQQESAPQPNTSYPSIFKAVQEQLGLKLEPAVDPMEFLIIDHVEKPSPN